MQSAFVDSVEGVCMYACLYVRMYACLYVCINPHATRNYG
jgi:hypothetical protein